MDSAPVPMGTATATLRDRAEVEAGGAGGWWFCPFAGGQIHENRVVDSSWRRAVPIGFALPADVRGEPRVRERADIAG